MPSHQVLEPVLEMKVDQLFLTWLSEPVTLGVLKDYLSLIKSGQSIDLGLGDARDKRSLSFNENNNRVSRRSLVERGSAPLNTPSSPPSSHTLPSGSGSSGRVGGANGRALRRSLSTKKVMPGRFRDLRSVHTGLVHSRLVVSTICPCRERERQYLELTANSCSNYNSIILQIMPL